MNNLSVLCVEDDNLLREVFAEFLARNAGKVVVAENGVEGLKSFHACKFDVVVTDISMPVMNGMVMAAHIKDSDPSVPIIFLTGTPEQLLELTRFDHRIDKVFRKPADLRKLSETLKQVAIGIPKQLAPVEPC